MGSLILAAAILGNVQVVDDELLKGNVTEETIMHMAAMHGHSELVKWLAHKHPQYVTKLDLPGRTPLHLAALYGKADVVIELLKLPQVNPLCEDGNKQIPLHLAALNGHISVITQLLECPKHHQHKQLIAVDTHGHTALQLAVQGAHVETVRCLLENFKAKQAAIQELTRKDHLGWTAVHSAAGVGRADIFEEIFTVWDPVILSHVNNTGWSPLHVASWLGRAEIVNWMCGKMGSLVNTATSNLARLTPLHLAAHNGHDAVVDYLLSHDQLQAGNRDALQRTALHYAARQGHASVVRKFLSSSKLKSAGQDSSLLVNATDVNGLTALHLAAREGYEQVVGILLEDQGANVNAETESSLISKSLLEVVLSSNSLQGTIVDPMILEADCWCISKMTPLHLAAKNGHMAVVRQLLKHPEVKISALDGHGLMPQDWAEVSNVKKDFEVCLKEASRLAGETSARVPKEKLQILREEMMKWKKRVGVIPWCTSHSFQSMQVFEYLANVGSVGKLDGKVSEPKASYNLQKEDTGGMNLQSASYDADMGTMKSLPQGMYGITVAQEELSGNTPLHAAVQRGNKKDVEVLVKCMAMDDVNAKNSKGQTPLALAFENNHVEICKLILQSSEKVEDDLCDMLKTAMARDWMDMVVLLLGDARALAGGGIGVDLLDEASHLAHKGILGSLLRRTTIKERLLQERKEHLDSAGAMLVIAALIASVTYQGDLQPPQGKHRLARLLFEWLNAGAFYSAVATTVAVVSGSLPIRHMYELVEARDPMRISRAISCVLLVISSACVIWAYAAAGFSKVLDNNPFNVGNLAGAIATTVSLFWVLKRYMQLYNPSFRSYTNVGSSQDNEGSICTLCRKVAEIVKKIPTPTLFWRQANDGLELNLL